MKNDLKRTDGGHKKIRRVSRNDLLRMIRGIEKQLASGRFVIEGERIIIPSFVDVEIKLKVEHDNKNELSIKIEWEKERKNENEREKKHCVEIDQEDEHENEDD